MGRDDFSRRTIETLANRAGNRCSNPKCGTPASGPRTDPEKAVNIGVAAYITAAAPGGPRYDPVLSLVERGSIENAIWLCQNCAKLIDNDSDRYTVELLRQLKQSSETQARDDLERRVPSALSQKGQGRTRHRLAIDLHLLEVLSKEVED